MENGERGLKTGDCRSEEWGMVCGRLHMRLSRPRSVSRAPNGKGEGEDEDGTNGNPRLKARGSGESYAGKKRGQ